MDTQPATTASETPGETPAAAGAYHDLHGELARAGLTARATRPGGPGGALATITVTSWTPGGARRRRGTVFRRLAPWASSCGLLLVNASPGARRAGARWAADLLIRPGRPRPGRPRPADALSRQLLDRVNAAVRTISETTAFRDGVLDKALARSTLTAITESVRGDLLAVEQLRAASGNAARAGALRAWPALRARATGRAPGERDATAKVTARVTALEQYAAQVLNAEHAYLARPGRQAAADALDHARQEVTARAEAHTTWADALTQLTADAEAVRHTYQQPH